MVKRMGILIMFLGILLNGKDMDLYGKLIKKIKVKDYNGVVLDFPERNKNNIVIFSNKISFSKKDCYLNKLIKDVIKFKEKISIWLITRDNYNFGKDKMFIKTIPDYKNRIKSIFDLKCSCDCISIGIIKNNKILYYGFSTETDFIKAFLEENLK